MKAIRIAEGFDNLLTSKRRMFDTSEAAGRYLSDVGQPLNFRERSGLQSWMSGPDAKSHDWMIFGFQGEQVAHAETCRLNGLPIPAVCARKPGRFASAFKRCADIGLSCLALIMLAPLMGLLCILIQLDSAGPAFYISDRIGRWGRPFRCYKFRTMVENAEHLKKALMAMNERDGILFKVSNDPRVTQLGRFLRKYSLDELPQLINVLRGEMSLVGPRPPVAAEVEKYDPQHLVRLEVLPGLTGLWQVESRQDPSFENYISLDRTYIENWTFWLDIKILFRTAGAIVRGTGS